MCRVLTLSINELLVELIKFCSKNLRDPLISNATMMPNRNSPQQDRVFLYHRLICSCAPTQNLSIMLSKPSAMTGF